MRRLEDAAQDLFVHGRLRSRAELQARVEAVTPEQVREAFQAMLAAPPSIAIAGRLGKGGHVRFSELIAARRMAATPAKRAIRRA